MFVKKCEKQAILAKKGHFLFIFGAFLGHFCIYGGLGGVFHDFSDNLLQISHILHIYHPKPPQNPTFLHKIPPKSHIWGKCGQIGRKSCNFRVFLVKLCNFMPILPNLCTIWTYFTSQIPYMGELWPFWTQIRELSPFLAQYPPFYVQITPIYAINR